MREIKFRAWDKTENHFISDFAINSVGDEIGKFSYRCHEWNWNEISPSFELMQYTGLKDKNGKGIYEGDIVQFISEESRAFNEIVFWDNEMLCWGLKAPTYNEPLSDMIDEDGEVIGNIYENPELLK